LHYVVAAVPPFAALLAFGALMRQVHRLIPDTTPVPAAVQLPAPETVAPPVTVERANDSPPPVRELPATPAPPAAPAVPAALVEHARKIADTHRSATGAPIDPATLRVRLGVPPALADAIAAQLA
jgi:hypothetical protein